MSDTATDTTTTTEGKSDTAATATNTTTEAKSDTDNTDLAAELEKWKAQARKHEDRAKANAAAAKELEDVRKASMSETEKAVAEAKALTRAEVLAEVGSTLVDAEVRAALAGRTVDVDAVLDGLNRVRFLGDDGQPDRDEIVAWVDRIAPKSETAVRSLDMGQGARGQAVIGEDMNTLLRRAAGRS